MAEKDGGAARREGAVGRVGGAARRKGTAARLGGKERQEGTVARPEREATGRKERWRGPGGRRPTKL